MSHCRPDRAAGRANGRDQLPKQYERLAATDAAPDGWRLRPTSPVKKARGGW